jgi:hypothetical protein
LVTIGSRRTGETTTRAIAARERISKAHVANSNTEFWFAQTAVRFENNSMQVPRKLVPNDKAA